MKVLTAHQRQSIVSLFIDDRLTQIEIAGRMGTSQSNVCKVLARNRRLGSADSDMPSTYQTRRKRRTYAASQLGSKREPMNLDWL
jgi:DNA-binding transcriptional regulator LsrR (DeoR family)